MSGQRELDTLSPPSKLTIYHRGPELDKGPLPSLFYFALSGEESLLLDPYNQPLNFLNDAPIRVFSFTLPEHGDGLENKTAMERWANLIRYNNNFIEEFISKCIENLDYLIDQDLIDPENIAVAGLSRGGFIASHFAARDTRIKSILAYAPLTRLDTIKAVQDILDHPLVKALPLENLIVKLAGRSLRFYIGNRDVLVQTDKCYQFIHKLADFSYDKGFRSPPAELIISPSIGYKGHGTPPHIFQDGVEWLKNKLL